jgi:hypothetical protein
MQYKMVDVNSTQYKQEMQRLQSLRTQIVLWLVVLALGIALIPLMLITRWVRNDVTRLGTELIGVQSALNSATMPSDEVMRLNAEVANFNQLVSTMHSVTVPSGIIWPVVVDAVARYEADAIEIFSLTQTDNKLQIAGRATSNDAVVRYQQNLIDTGRFRDVVVISMSTVPPPPTPVATPTPAPDGASNGATAAEAVDLPFGNVEFIMDVVVDAVAGAVVESAAQ